MIGIIFTFLLCAVSLAAAVPTTLQKRQWSAQSPISSLDDGVVNEFAIHESCNQTEVNQLRFAFEETELLAAHARDHVLRYGNESAVYRKYFGSFPPHEVIGAFSMVLNGDRAGLLFRCDDPDGNCAATGKYTCTHINCHRTSIHPSLCLTSAYKIKKKKKTSAPC